MNILSLFSRSYVEWEDYQKLLDERNGVLFMHKSAVEDLKTREGEENGHIHR